MKAFRLTSFFLALLPSGLLAQQPPVAAELKALAGSHFYVCDTGAARTVSGDVDTGREVTITGAEFLRGDSSVSDGTALLRLDLRSDRGAAGTIVALISDRSTTARQILASLYLEDISRPGPVGSLEIGAPISDVFCWLGKPDHVNTDALGSDQLVYERDQTYVYVGHDSRVVTDIQTSR